jgi:NAD+ kinase
MRFRKIKVISNPLKHWAKETARQVTTHLRKSGYSIVERKADLTICVGGDGTILFANHKKRIDGAVLGIGSEKSFICQLTRRNWRKGVLPILREGKTEPRQTLLASSAGKSYTAINDFVIHAKDYRIIELDVRMGGRARWFEADGIITSTATGSYAYAFSAGGRKLPLSSRKTVVVPICPYKRRFRPSVLPNNGKIVISVNRESGFIVDGIFIRNVRAGEKVTVRPGRPIKFIKKQ